MKSHRRGSLFALPTLIAGLLVLAFAAAGCGRPASGGTAQTSGSSRKLVVGLASEGLNAPFPVAIASGVKSAAAAHGVKSVVLDGKLAETTQESDIQTLIAEHVNGIIIDVIDPGPTAAMVKQAQAAQIPVILVHGYAGNAPSPVYPGVAYEVDENEVHAGTEAGQLALKAVPAGGQVGIITGTPGYNAVTLRENGFDSVIRPTGKYKVVAVQPGNWLATGGYSACSSILRAHPQISLFYNESDDMAIGCAKAEKAAGSTAKIVSLGGESALKPLMAQGSVYATVCYQPKTEGQIAMTAMYKLLTGQAHYNRTLNFYDTPPITRANLSSCGWQW